MEALTAASQVEEERVPGLTGLEHNWVDGVARHHEVHEVEAADAGVRVLLAAMT